MKRKYVVVLVSVAVVVLLFLAAVGYFSFFYSTGKLTPEDWTALEPLLPAMVDEALLGTVDPGVSTKTHLVVQGDITMVYFDYQTARAADMLEEWPEETSGVTTYYYGFGIIGKKAGSYYFSEFHTGGSGVADARVEEPAYGEVRNPYTGRSVNHGKIRDKRVYKIESYQGHNLTHTYIVNEGDDYFLFISYYPHGTEQELRFYDREGNYLY